MQRRTFLASAAAYSDLDITLVTKTQPANTDTAERFLSFLQGTGSVLAIFRADHLGQGNTIIAYIQLDDWVVKVDARMIDGTKPFALPKETRILRDVTDALVLATAQEAPRPDVAILFGKLCGWFWFTHARVERGELFAAARSIDFSRENALLPIILNRLSLPQDGHRRIEERLPAQLLDSLALTYPTALSKKEIFRSLQALYDLTETELLHADFDGRLTAIEELRAMWQAIGAARSKQHVLE